MSIFWTLHQIPLILFVAWVSLDAYGTSGLLSQNDSGITPCASALGGLFIHH